MRTEDLSIDERRKNIVEMLNRQGKLKVSELAAHYGISEVTIRSDLDELEKQGLLERVHGGAITTYRAYYNMNLLERAKTNEAEKRRIAERASSLICNGDSIMLSAGTTTLYVIECLRERKNLTVVTNSIAIAQEADRYPHIEMILLGGSINAQYQFTYGAETITQLRKYRVDKLILTADGISAEEGVTTGFAAEAEIDRQMIGRANQTILACDYTKIGRVGFAHIATVESVDYLVTDTCAVRAETEAIAGCGVEILRA